jgi:hypothetical protein
MNEERRNVERRSMNEERNRRANDAPMNEEGTRRTNAGGPMNEERTCRTNEVSAHELSGLTENESRTVESKTGSPQERT